jgi:ADP-heptose:LPS heptosyltransferase
MTGRPPAIDAGTIGGLRRVLIFRLGSLGDTVVALPCLNRVVELTPNAERIAVTNVPVSRAAPSLASMLVDGGFIDDVIDYPVGARSPRLLLDLARRIRALEAEALIYIGGGRGVAAAWRDVAFFRLAGLKRIIGAPLSADLERPRIDRVSGEVEREAARLVRCLAALGSIDLTEPGAWTLRLTAAERAAADAILAPLAGLPFLAINMGGKLTAKYWGAENWSALMGKLAARLDLGLVIVGGEDDRADAARVGARWSGPVIDACGRLSPRQTSAVLERAAAFVGHDSGPLHLAAAAGAPCVGLFGSLNAPKKWHPIGERHRILHDQAGVARITVEETLAAVLDVVRLSARVSATA